MKRWLVSCTVCLTVALAAATAKAQSDPIKVLATIGMVGDVVDNVGGECVKVTTLMGPGVDPHLYQARAQDVQRFQDAEVILYSGYSLEGQLGDVLERFSATKPTVAVSPTSIEPGELISVQDIYGIDPHLWMDPSLWARIAPVIAQTLGELRPDCADEMQANATRYVAQLNALHEWVTQSIASIPEKQRILVTAHDAFAYYGRAYGIEVEGIQGISTEAEPAVADIRETVDLVVQREVPAIFVESTINPRTIQAVIDAARERGHEVVIGGQLFSDAMGEKGTAGGTYIGMIYENTVNIVEALGGNLPTIPEELRPWAEEWNIAASE